MYKSSKDFDLEMARLFEKARRYHEPGSEAYGRALLLQVSYDSTLFPPRNPTGDLASVPSNHLAQSTRPTLHPFNELRILAGRTWECQTSA
jgi:chromatin structure-remodeling complex subunit RSC1/2